MVDTVAKRRARKSLSQNDPLSLVGFYPKSKQVKRQSWAEAHLKPRRINGKLYYYYCKGSAREIYLGSAESILKAVKGGESSD